MAEECVICGAPLEYLNTEEQMECALCHKKELSGARCVKGHYVCNECHTKGVDTIIGTCLASSSKDPIEIIRTLMEQPFCHMHGPEHHIMVGAALLTAYHNAGGGGKRSPGAPAGSGGPAARPSAPGCSCPSSPGPPRCPRSPGGWPIP